MSDHSHPRVPGTPEPVEQNPSAGRGERGGRGWTRAIAPVLFLFLLALGLCTFRDYGLFWDELDLREHMGNRFIDYALGGERQNLAKNSFDVYHGPALEMLYTGVERALGQTDTREIFELRHLLNYLVFLAGVLAFYKLTRIWFAERGYALLGTLLFVFCPRIFPDAFYNSKDAGFLSIFTICLYTQTRFCLRPRVLSGGAHALACGFLIAVRNLGILIPPLTVLLLVGEMVRDPGLRKPRAWLPGLSAYLLLLPAFTILFWPTLWRYPVTHFIQALVVNGKFPWTGNLLLMGKYVSSLELPWYYAPVWIAVTLPPLHLLLAGSGLAAVLFALLRAPRAFIREHWTARTPVLQALYTIFAPVSAIIALHAVIYNGWRHLYFILPGIIAVGLHGARWLWEAAASRPRLRTGMLAAAGCLLLSIGIDMIRLHPFENLYFNPLAGRDLSAARKRFDFDPMGVTYRAGLEYIVAHDPAPLIRIHAANTGGEYNGVLLRAEDRSRVKFVPDPGQADYFISNYSTHLAPYIFPNEVLRIKRKGATVVSVFKLRASPPVSPADGKTAER